MVTQYNHFLFVQVFGNGEDSKRDEEGNWIDNSPTWKFHSMCREETNGKRATIQGIDGKVTVFSSLVHLPKGTPRISEGTQILVSESKSSEGIIRITGPALKYDPGQLHCRLWV